jgi:hypothetical protein
MYKMLYIVYLTHQTRIVLRRQRIGFPVEVKMAPLPAVCMTCGYAFSAPNLIGGSGARVTITNVRTNCRRCGGIASILDGVYEIANDSITAISGGTLTPNQISRLSDIRNQLLNSGNSAQISHEIVEAVKAVSPELGAAVELMKKQKLGLAALVLVLFLWLKQCGAEGGGITIDMSQQTTNITNVYSVNPVYVDSSKNDDGSGSSYASGDGTKGKKN